jgi:hypothetical protein
MSQPTMLLCAPSSLLRILANSDGGHLSFKALGFDRESPTFWRKILSPPPVQMSETLLPNYTSCPGKP